MSDVIVGRRTADGAESAGSIPASLNWKRAFGGEALLAQGRNMQSEKATGILQPVSRRVSAAAIAVFVHL